MEAVHKALGNQVRKNILQAVSEKPRYLSEISRIVERRPQTVDFHLKFLERASLVKSELRNGKKYYILTDREIFDSAKYKGRPAPRKTAEELILDLWKDINRRLERIESTVARLERKKRAEHYY